MKLSRIASACVAPILLHLTALSAPALAQPSSPSAFERAMLAELDARTREEVESRATAGNSVMGVVSTILLNNYQAAGARTRGAALSVVAVDFSRGMVVIRRAPNAFEVRRFDPRTLRLLR